MRNILNEKKYVVGFTIGLYFGMVMSALFSCYACWMDLEWCVHQDVNQTDFIFLVDIYLYNAWNGRHIYIL